MLVTGIMQMNISLFLKARYESGDNDENIIVRIDRDTNDENYDNYKNIIMIVDLNTS